MAVTESLVAVTPGAGKNLHTVSRTTSAGLVEDEVVILGEQSLPTYFIMAGPVVLTTAASHLVQIMAGASLKVRIRRIEIWQQAAVTAASLFDLLLYRVTTAGTGGAAGAVQPLDTADVAAGATVSTLPTVKGTEAANPIARAFPYLIQTIGASTPFTNPVAAWDFDRPRSKPLIIAAGAANGIVIKNTNASAAGALVFNVWLDETSYL